MDKIVIDQDQFEVLKRNVTFLSDGFDAVIAQFSNSQKEEDDDGTIPFVVLSAVSNVLIKLAIIMGGEREIVLEILNDLMPTNEELKELEAEGPPLREIVVPTSGNVH